MKAKVKNREVINLSKDMEQRIIDMATKTWSAIGGDVLQMIAELDRKDYAVQADVVEMVGDASRMKVFGEDEEAYAAYSKMTWNEGRKILKKAFPYKQYS